MHLPSPISRSLQRLAAGIALPLALLVSPAAMAQEEAEPETPTEGAAAEVRDIDPALWVLKDDDTTIYLFGTIHLLRPGLGWFDDRIEEAFDASDELVLEIIAPEDQAAAATTFAIGMDQTGTSLRDRLSDEQRATYEAALASLNLPVGMFDKFKPWYAAVVLSILPLQAQGFDPTAGAEMTLTGEAKTETKKIDALETIEQQLGFLDSLPDNEQIAYLVQTAEGVPEMADYLDQLVEAWGEGDVDRVAELMNAGMTPGSMLEDVLLTQRNIRWAQWLDERMDEPGTVFVAVGAAHLAGDNSVQVQLDKLGLSAERVIY